MKTRIFGYALCLTVLPLGSTFLILSHQSRPLLTAVILLLTFVFQLPVIQSCKRALQPFICPDTSVLLEMHVDYVPIAYEPGRFRIDTRVSSWAMWLSMGAPVLIWLGTLLPPQPAAVTTASTLFPPLPHMAQLVLVAMLLLFLGVMAFPYWFETSRAAAIYAEGSDRKRYLLCGFAWRLQKQSCAVKDYLRTCKGRCSY